MTQNQWILDNLRRGPISPIDALQGCGCFRLAARVQELRQDGHIILTERAQANGKQFAQYILIKEK
jgi:hypothetical protein